MRLSKEEKEIIEKYRANKRTEEERNAPKLVGYSKQDLYGISTATLKEVIDGFHGWYLSKKEVDQIINKSFDLIVPAGTEFVCYLKNGIESWYDTVYGIEDMNSDWAKEYLKGIKPYKKEKSH